MAPSFSRITPANSRLWPGKHRLIIGHGALAHGHGSQIEGVPVLALDDSQAAELIERAASPRSDR